MSNELRFCFMQINKLFYCLVLAVMHEKFKLAFSVVMCSLSASKYAGDTASTTICCLIIY